MLRRANVVAILPQWFAAKWFGKDFHRIHHKPRSDLIQATVFRQNLEIPEPNAIVDVGECDHFIEEWLWFWMMLWHAEDLREQLLQKFQVWHLVEMRVERQQRSWAVQTIAGQLELAHGVNVFDEEFSGRSVGNVCEPNV